MRTLLLMLALAGPIPATDFLPVDKVDAERQTVTVRVPRTDTTILATFGSYDLGYGLTAGGIVYTPFVYPADYVATFSLRKGSYLSGDGKELSAERLAKLLKPGVVLVVGGEELRAGVKGGVFKPDAVILIRAGGSPARPPANK